MVEKYKKLDEIPFDFTRRMMSVLVTGSRRQGHPPHQRSAGGGLPPLLALRAGRQTVADGSGPDRRAESTSTRASATTVSECWRWQTKELAGKQICAKADERELVLKGYVAFLDPPKSTAATRHRSASQPRRRGENPNRG